MSKALEQAFKILLKDGVSQETVDAMKSEHREAKETALEGTAEVYVSENVAEGDIILGKPIMRALAANVLSTLMDWTVTVHRSGSRSLTLTTPPPETEDAE